MNRSQAVIVGMSLAGKITVTGLGVLVIVVLILLFWMAYDPENWSAK